MKYEMWTFNKFEYAISQITIRVGLILRQNSIWFEGNNVGPKNLSQDRPQVTNSKILFCKKAKAWSKTESYKLMVRLEEEIKLANKDKTFLSHDKTSFMLKEKIHEFLYENEVLEKYLRGEYFRTFDETISGLKNSLELLNKDKDT